MKNMSKAIRSFADLILILAWMYIIANGLHFNGWLIFLSIVFWFGDTVFDEVKKEEK